MKLWHSSWNKIQTGLNRIHAAQKPIHHPRPWADKRIAVRRGECVRLYSREPQVHGQVAADVNHERTSTVISTVNTNMAENGSTYVSCMSKKRELNATISHHINFNVRCSGGSLKIPLCYLARGTGACVWVCCAVQEGFHRLEVCPGLRGGLLGQVILKTQGTSSESVNPAAPEEFSGQSQQLL